MARTLNARWLAAFRRAQVSPVVIVRLEVQGFDETRGDVLAFSWCSGGAPLFGYPCSIADLSTLSVRVDPITRKVSVGQFTVTFVDDGTLRSVASLYPLKNASLTISLGTPDLAEADFEPIASRLRVDEIIPQPGSLEVSATDVKSEPFDLEDVPFEFPDHPALAMQTILRRSRGRLRSLAPDANFSIAASDTSHFVACRQQFHPAPDDGIAPAENAREPVVKRLHELTRITHSILRSNALGEAELVPWDPAAPATDFALGADDFTDFGQLITLDNIITRVTCDSAIKGIESTGARGSVIEIEPRYAARDDEAELILVGPYDGYTRAEYAHSVATPWFSAGCNVGTLFGGGTLAASATTLPVIRPLWHGFCGTLPTDRGIRARPDGSLISTGFYGAPNSGSLWDPTLGVNAIGVDRMRDGTATWDDVALAASYSGPGNYSSSNVVIVWSTSTGVELGRSIVTGASASGTWIRFEAISPSLAASLGQQSLAFNGAVVYQLFVYGTVASPLSSTIAAAQQVSVSRPGYVLLIDRDTLNTEIVKTTAFSYDTSYGYSVKQFPGSPQRFDDDLGLRAYWNRGSFTIVRGQLGTTAQSFGSRTMAFDITIAHWLTETLLDRAHFGIPQAELRVPLSLMGIEVGDVGTLVEPLVMGHLISGSTASNMTWEVVGAELDVLSESPGIKLSLAMASIPAHDPVIYEPEPPPELLSPSLDPYFDASANIYVDGFALIYTTRT